MLEKLLLRLEKTSQVMVWIGGGLLIFASIMTTIDVILRKTISWSFGGADEIAGYLFAISTAFAFAFATIHRAHVRIDALYVRLPSKARLVLDILGFVLLGGFIGIMTERAYSVWWGSFENSSVSITPLVTPLALPQGFWFAGLVFSMLVFTVMLLCMIVALFNRDRNRIAKMIGPRGLEEEVKEEREHALAEIAREHARMGKKEDD